MTTPTHTATQQTKELITTRQPPAMDRTRTTFVKGLKEGNPKAWEEFYARYRKLIAYVARKLGCPEAQAEDIIQETALALFMNMKSFEYDRTRGKFRNLVWIIAMRKVFDLKRRAAHGGRLEGEHPLLAEPEAPGPTPLTQLIIDELDKLGCAIVKAALQSIRKEVKPLDYQIFDLHFLKELSVDEVLGSVTSTRDQVYVITSRVKKKCLEAVERLADPSFNLDEELAGNRLGANRIKLGRPAARGG
jgi:RNA polymerase sigma-70 factor, ECF subfamily